MAVKMRPLWLSVLLVAGIFLSFVFPADVVTVHASSIPVMDDVEAQDAGALDLAPSARSAILMDADPGTVLFEKNADEKLPPASITKVMTMLLVMEALDQGVIRLDEMVTASEHAASMGGSQIFLEAGEEMTVEDLLKGVALASGNDASVALAEKIAGSESLFVEMMNKRAQELGLKNTRFQNSSGLPAEDHYSTARDIAIMSRELLKHEEITQYTGLYQDYLRKDTEKPFWLVNTNKLVRFYTGADGLKTGYTSSAKFCLTATAKRDDFRVIAVVLGAPDAKTRNKEVSQMFDYAFSQYKVHPILAKGETIGSYKIEKGSVPELEFVADRRMSVLLKKSDKIDDIRHELTVSEPLKLPIAKGQIVAHLNVYNGDKKIAEFPLPSPVDVEKAGWWTLFKRSATRIFVPAD